MKTKITLFLLFLLAGTLTAQNLENRMDSLMQGYVDQGKIHGCMVYIVQNGSVVLKKPYGYMDIEQHRKMEPDAIFGIASMTKLLTAATALTLYEDGKFLLDDPVKKYIPEFADLRVLSPECTSEDSLITLLLERDVTIRDLFRHTGGFTYGGNDIIGILYDQKIGDRSKITLKEFVERITSVPLKFQPGSRWEYSYSNDILGYLVEVVSGKPLDEYMQEALLKPLQMNNTGFYVPVEKLYKLCNHYIYKDDTLILLENSATSRFSKKPVFISGGGGGVSTVEDYAKLCQMLLNYGEFNGRQLFRKETVELIISNQIGEIKDRGFSIPGFGLGLGVQPKVNNGGTSSCFWAGSPYNDTYFFDYNKQLIAIMLIQNSPWSHLGLMDKFNSIVNEEIK